MELNENKAQNILHMGDKKKEDTVMVTTENTNPLNEQVTPQQEAATQKGGQENQPKLPAAENTHEEKSGKYNSPSLIRPAVEFRKDLGLPGISLVERKLIEAEEKLTNKRPWLFGHTNK